MKQFHIETPGKYRFWRGEYLERTLRAPISISSYLQCLHFGGMKSPSILPSAYWTPMFWKTLLPKAGRGIIFWKTTAGNTELEFSF